MVVSGEIRGFEEAELKGLSGDWEIRLARQRDGAFISYGSWARAKTSFGVSGFWGLIPLSFLAETVTMAQGGTRAGFGFLFFLGCSVKSKKKLKLETQQHVSSHSWRVIWLSLSLKKNQRLSPASRGENIWLCLHHGLQGRVIPDICPPLCSPCSRLDLPFRWPAIWRKPGLWKPRALSYYSFKSVLALTTLVSLDMTRILVVT